MKHVCAIQKISFAFKPVKPEKTKAEKTP